MKYFTKFTIVLILFYMTSNTEIKALYLDAIYNDSYPQFCSGVTNTGNAAISYMNSRNLRVMVWDGDTPGFYFEDDYNNLNGTINLDGMNLGHVVDPDIVLGRDGAVYAFIVYLIDNDVYYEVWDYNGNSWNLTVSATQVTGTQRCSSPNVDILPDLYNVAFVYEEQGAILGHACDVTGQNLGSHTLLASKGKDPDVSCFEYGANVSAFNFTYLEQNGNNLFLYVAYDANYQNLVNSTPNITTLTLGVVNTSQLKYFGKPRIASSSELLSANTIYQVVVEYFDGMGKHYIYSYNSANANSPYTVNVNTNPGCDLLLGNNHSPVVSYAGDNITVAWVYDDSQLNYGSGTIDVLSRQLYSQDGTGSNSVTAYKAISVVNNYVTGVQEYPSVCGRYTYEDFCLITFYNQNTSYIGYKNVSAGTYQYRKPAELNSVLYPNPTSESINLQIDKKFVGGYVEIYNIVGELVDRKDITSPNFSVDLYAYRNGYYFLKLYNSVYSETHHFEILK